MNGEFLSRLLNADPKERQWLLTEAALESLPPDLKQAVWALAVSHWFDLSIVAALCPNLAEKATEIYNELQKLSFVETFGERGHNIHEATRKILLDKLWDDSPEKFREISALAADYFSEDDENLVERMYHKLVGPETENEDFLEIEDLKRGNVNLQSSEFQIITTVLAEQMNGNRLDKRIHRVENSQHDVENTTVGNITFANTFLDAAQEIVISGVGGVPPNFTQYWVDREHQYQLREYFNNCSAIEIVGCGGCGKSSLAAWAYENFREHFTKRMWVNFGTPQAFDRVARWILQEIGFPITDPQWNEEMLLSELLYRLNDPNAPVKALVVLDQLETIADSADHIWFEQFLSQWAENGKESRVLVTTRSAFLSQGTILLEGMNVEEGLTFLAREGLTGECLYELVVLADGHPLLLKLAASWTRETYDARVDDRAIDFFGKLFSNYKGDPTAGVEAIFEVNFRALPSALQILLFGLSVYRLPIDLVMAQVIDASATGESLEVLSRQGLLLSQGTQFVLHPLVTGLVRSRVTEVVKKDSHERAISYYNQNYREWDGTVESCRSELESFYHSCELKKYGQACEILNQCFGTLYRVSEWRLLLPLTRQLASEWKAIDDRELKNLGWTWVRLGSLHQNLSDYRAAIEAYFQSQEIFNQINFSEGKAAVFGNLGVAYRSIGDYEKAIDFYFKSMEIEQEIGDRRSIADSLGNLGNAYDSLGDYQKAIDFYSQSLKIKQEIGDRSGIATSLSELGSAYQVLGDYQKATDFYTQSIETKQEIGDRSGLATSLGNLGNVYHALGNYQQAIELHLQCLEIKQAIGDRAGIATSLSGLGNAYYSLGEYKKAIELHSQCLEIKQEIGDRWGMGASLFNIAQTQSILGEPSQALLDFQQSRSIYEELKLNHMVEQCKNAIRKCTQAIATTR